ncbi:MAG TPA: Lrp/AsnC family transcriptional regulator [Gemmatimonadales bacterium]|nr:Lrp/AsnC family transcriptional regulator [Gemmatimonadales bacterium]
MDARIIEILQTNGRISNAEVARQVDMAPSAVLERIRKLESRGVIQGYEVRLAPETLGLGLLAFVFVRADERVGDESAGQRLAAIPEVLEVHHVAGEDCYLVKLRAEGTEALGRILRDSFGAIPQVRTTRTTIVLSSVKESTTLPLPEVAAEETPA